MSLRTPILVLAAALVGFGALSAQGWTFVERDTVVVTGKIRLPATLSIPSDARHAPAVVLVHGSGPNDRDETVGANQPFRDLAEGQTSRGIVVLRYEKRSKAASLSFMGRSFTVDDEVVGDGLSAVALLRGLPEVDPARVVVLGHSFGGTLAPRIGQRDSALAGLVILAGATRPLPDMIEAQLAYMRGLPRADTAAIDKALSGMAPSLAAVRALTPADSGSHTLVLGAPATFWLDLAAYHPAKVAAGLPMHILILQGGRDYQVTMIDFEAWREGLAGNTAVYFREYSALNHLFIAGGGPSTPVEYGVAGSVDGQVIVDIADRVKCPPARLVVGPLFSPSDCIIGPMGSLCDYSKEDQVLRSITPMRVLHSGNGAERKCYDVDEAGGTTRPSSRRSQPDPSPESEAG